MIVRIVQSSKQASIAVTAAQHSGHNAKAPQRVKAPAEGLEDGADWQSLPAFLLTSI